MKISNRQKGQTLIETAIILVLLLFIVFGITEFARAWFLKNSVKNAARTGARVAVVTAVITNNDDINNPRTNSSDPGGDPTVCGALTGNNKVFCYIWTSPGIGNGASASLTIEDTSIPGGDGIVPNAGDTVSISVTTPFKRVVPNLLLPFIPSQFSADASMRYE